MKVGFFSTDWSFEPVLDQYQTNLYGKPIYVKGKKKATYGGTYYYRGAMPAMALDQHDGFECLLSWAIDNAPDGHIRVMDTNGEWHDDCDVIWFQRWMHEDGVSRAERAKAAGQIIINDVDDNFWQLGSTNIAYHTTDPKNNPSFNRAHYRKMLAASSAITVSTAPLARELERLGPPVHILRNCIDIERWQPHDPGKPTGMVGWVGGIQWRAHDLQVLKPTLAEFLEDYGLPFYHGGDSSVPGVKQAYELLGIDKKSVQCAVAPLCNITEYPSLWEPINLALVPLERCAFNQSKSHLKGLEASACGIPFIYSNHMPEYELFGAGIAADNAKPYTWRRALDSMLDPDARRAEGARNLAIAQQWDIRDRWTQWADVFNEYAPATPRLAVAA